MANSHPNCPAALRKAPSNSCSRDSLDSFAEPEGQICPKGAALSILRRLRTGLKACKRLRQALGQLGVTSALQGSLQSDCLCPICSNIYDCVLSLPLCLPCGHSLCSACVLRLAQRCNLACPFDRTRVEGEVLMVPVNLALAALAASEQDAAQCPIHAAQVVGYCMTTNTPLCGFCRHDSEHRHVLADSEEADEVMKELLSDLAQRLSDSGALSRQLSSWTQEVESLLLRLTIRFNGFSLLIHLSSEEKRHSKRISDALLKVRAELEECQKAAQVYSQRVWSTYWNSLRVPRWQLCFYRFPGLPSLPPLHLPLETTAEWLRDLQ